MLLFGASTLFLASFVQAPDPEHQRRVSLYEPFGFRNAETPFLVKQEFIALDRIPPQTELIALAERHDVIVEVCAPSRRGDLGQWTWPEDSLSGRERQCNWYGTPRETKERQP